MNILYIYIYVYTYVCIYIYIYMYKSRGLVEDPLQEVAEPGVGGQLRGDHAPEGIIISSSSLV